MKALYRKVNHQTESLKGLWAIKMNLNGKAGLATRSDVTRYEEKLRLLEEELQRRKELGHKYQGVMQRMKQLADNDEQSREDHQVLNMPLLCVCNLKPHSF